ncbi:MAG: hypothetical protein EBV03_11170 [Proteobacteria bacterium]|nr:hypothetical protein [Pseudomonadota bacterium]
MQAELSAAGRNTSRLMTEHSYTQQQDALDDIVRDYLKKHPDFAAFVQEKDAALKGMPLDDVRALMPVYPGVIAIAAQSAAHRLYESGSAADKIKARRLTEAAHSRTGIDIHPGTRIGDNCFIDHGTGVIIGETAKIGQGTLIYHDVTLGAYGNPEEKDPQKLARRHPEIGKYCTVSVGAKVLGNAKIGDHVTLGPDSLLFGNRLQVESEVNIGSGAQVGDDNHIAKGVRIGAGAIIPRGVGLIDRNVPPYSHVSRDHEGQLQFGVTIPQSLLDKIKSRIQETASGALTYHI